MEKTHYTLYSREEEAEIFKAIRAGEAAEKMLSKTRNSDMDFIAGLHKKIEKGKRLREEFIVNNTPLCVRMAKRYGSNFLIDNPEQFDDLVIEAQIGLFRAVDLFNPAFDTKFSTYATYWIRRYIYNYIVSNQHILLPSVSAGKKCFQMKKYLKDCKANNYSPSIAEIAINVNCSVATVRSLLPTLTVPASLDEVNDVTSISETIFGNSESSVNKVLREEFESFLCELLNCRENTVIRAYLGLDNTENTLETIGDKLGVTRERIRQIKDHALGKLSGSKDVYEYLHMLVA